MKRNLLAVTALFLLLGGGIALLLSRNTTHEALLSNVVDDHDEFDLLLDAVAEPVALWMRTNGFNQEQFVQSMERRKLAIAKLREFGTNALPRLMLEVRQVGLVEATNRQAAWLATMRLGEAFTVFGSQAEPLLPQLVEEFHASRSIGPSVLGLVHIGGTEAGLTLVSGLTNSDPFVRNGVMSALSGFESNSIVAHAALPPLLLRLQEPSELSRALASSLLGSLRVNPETVIPALLQISEFDPDPVVRATALKAVGRFGTNAVSAKPINLVERPRPPCPANCGHRA